MLIGVHVLHESRDGLVSFSRVVSSIVLNIWLTSETACWRLFDLDQSLRSEWKVLFEAFYCNAKYNWVGRPATAPKPTRLKRNPAALIGRGYGSANADGGTKGTTGWAMRNAVCGRMRRLNRILAISTREGGGIT
jgi:hypothetical protein